VFCSLTTRSTVTLQEDLQKFVQGAQQQAGVHAVMDKFTDMCFKKCVARPGTSVSWDTVLIVLASAGGSCPSPGCSPFLGPYFWLQLGSYESECVQNCVGRCEPLTRAGRACGTVTALLAHPARPLAACICI